MPDRIDALHDSVHRLAGVIAALDDRALERSAYPTEWTVADVLSHVGSGAVILQRRLDDALSGTPTPDDAAQAVWDAWNAKAPAEQAADCAVTDRALLERIESLGADDRARVRVELGPMALDLDGFVAMRLNEHALHLWDIEVASDPTATVAPTSVPWVVDNLAMWAGFTGRPAPEGGTVVVATTDPQRRITLTLGPDRVAYAARGPRRLRRRR